MVTYFRLYDLPWESGREEEQRFHKILKQFLIAVTVLSIVFSFLPVPDVDHALVKKVPPRFAKLILDKPKPLPPPPVVIEQPKPEELKPAYRRLADEYAFLTKVRYGKGYVAYEVLADLVLAGWRSTGEAHPDSKL